MPDLHWGSNYAFYVGSLKHVVVVLTLVATAFAMVAGGRRIDAAPRRQIERSLGLILLGVWLFGGLWDLINPHATASTTLPLHWCDLAGALAFFVMFCPQYRVPRAVLHFWALGICSFAFVLPAIGLGPAVVDFWFYFGAHAAIILAAVYDRGVRGFRPEAKDLAWAWSLAAVWVLCLQPVNLLLHSNYGFVGADDKNVRKAIVALGNWPWRLMPMLAIEGAIMCSILFAERMLAMGFTHYHDLRSRGYAPLRFPIARDPALQLQRAA